MELKQPAATLNGFGISAINLYQEALVENNEHLLHAIESAAKLWVKKKMGVSIDIDETVKDDTIPDGWALHHHRAIQKSVLVPLNSGPRKDEVKDIVCWVKYKGTWQSVLLRAKSDFASNRFLAGRVFNFVQSLYLDMNYNESQAFYETALLDSAETVLLVEPEVIDWILADNKKES